MLDGRRNPRYESIAHAEIPGILEGKSVLKNISITGCCVECTGSVNLQDDTEYQLEIKPEGASHIGNFSLQVEHRWIRKDGDATEIGLDIVASPKGRHFQRYVDFLAYSHSPH